MGSEQDGQLGAGLLRLVRPVADHESRQPHHQAAPSGVGRKRAGQHLFRDPARDRGLGGEQGQQRPGRSRLCDKVGGHVTLQPGQYGDRLLRAAQRPQRQAGLAQPHHRPIIGIADPGGGDGERRPRFVGAARLCLGVGEGDGGCRSVVVADGSLGEPDRRGGVGDDQRPRGAHQQIDVRSAAGRFLPSRPTEQVDVFGRCVEQSTGQRAPPGRAQPPRRHGKQQRMGEAEKDLTLTGVAGHDALLVQFHDGFGRDDRGQGVVRQRLAQRQHVARFGRGRSDVLDPALQQLAETGRHLGVARPPPHATDLRQPAGCHPEPDQFRQVQRVAGRGVNRQAVNGHAVTENRCRTRYVDGPKQGSRGRTGGFRCPTRYRQVRPAGRTSGWPGITGGARWLLTGGCGGYHSGCCSVWGEGAAAREKSRARPASFPARHRRRSPRLTEVQGPRPISARRVSVITDLGFGSPGATRQNRQESPGKN